jgi:three-Cys-motif partner protein
MRSIEIFINFMVMDMNMNVLLRDPSKAEDPQIARMDRFWGDRSWREVAYEVSRQMDLFGKEEEVKVEGANDKIAEAYRKRLTDVAGFGYAPRPLRFVNSLGRTIYYLFFASPNRTGESIVEYIFEKYRKKQGL